MSCANFSKFTLRKPRHRSSGLTIVLSYWARHLVLGGRCIVQERVPQVPVIPHISSFHQHWLGAERAQ
jgi:hypothetical protein